MGEPEGRTAIVTGAGRGTGLATAEKLSEAFSSTTLTERVAKKWGALRLNFNAVAFVINTGLTRLRDQSDVVEREGEQIQLGVTERGRAVLRDFIPLGRPGTLEEAARAIYFHCSPLSDYVHGQAVNVSGGLTFGMRS